MPSYHKRSSGKSKKERNNENEKIDRSRKRKRHEKPSDDMRPFTLGQLNTTLITAKRLSTGMRGIFGNGRQSNSIYRDIQQRIDNKKMSKTVACEIETSLMKIVCKKNTPKSSDSLQLLQNVYSGIGSGGHDGGNSHQGPVVGQARKTPLLMTAYLKRAEKIKDRIAELSVFQGCECLKELKDKLKKIHQTKISLTINSKFERNESQESSPSVKRNCSQHSSQDSCMLMNSESTSSQQNRDQILEESAAKIIAMEESANKSLADEKKVSKTMPNISPKNRHQNIPNNFLMNFNPINEFVNIGAHRDHRVDSYLDYPKQHNQNMNLCSTINPYNYGNEREPFINIKNNMNTRSFKLDENRNSTSREIKEMGNTCNTFNTGNSLNAFDDILRKPINMLRSGRSTSSKKQSRRIHDHIIDRLSGQSGGSSLSNSTESTARPSTILSQRTSMNDERSSDFLDFIDSIPLHTLEEKLLRGECASSITEFKKPLLESPSPPKMYRMSMF